MHTTRIYGTRICVCVRRFVCVLLLVDVLVEAIADSRATILFLPINGVRTEVALVRSRILTFSVRQ